MELDKPSTAVPGHVAVLVTIYKYLQAIRWARNTDGQVHGFSFPTSEGAHLICIFHGKYKQDAIVAFIEIRQT